MAAVTEHRHAIDDLGHLIQSVRDVENRHAIGAQLLDDTEQLNGFGFRERRRGLVHDQHTRVERERLGNLHHLLLRDRQRADQRGRLDGQTDPLQIAPCVGVELAVINERAALGLARQEDVLCHRQMRHEIQLLMDDRNAGRLRLGCRRKPHRFTPVRDDAIVCGVLAADDLHQGGFAGTVLAADGMDFAHAQIQIHTIQRNDAGKAFADALQAKNLLQHRRSGAAYVRGHGISTAHRGLRCVARL